MVDTVTELESAPLVGIEWTEDHVIDGAFLTEEGFYSVEKLVQVGEALGGKSEEVGAGERS